MYQEGLARENYVEPPATNLFECNWRCQYHGGGDITNAIEFKEADESVEEQAGVMELDTEIMWVNAL